MEGDPTCVFDVDRALVEALDSRFGPPVDSYVMGWQVWLEPSPAGVQLEYRLHPPAGFVLPHGLHPEELWDEVTGQLDRSRMQLGEELRSLAELWVLLEVYPAFGDRVEAELLRAWAESDLARQARAAGYVDHARLGRSWERRPGEFDLPGALLEQLRDQRLS